MEKSIITACDFIISSKKKLTSMRIMYNESNMMSSINIFFKKYPQYIDIIIIKDIKYEIKTTRKNNSEYIGYYLILDKKYIATHEKKLFNSITKKCQYLIKHNILVDIINAKIHNLDELEYIISHYYQKYPCENEFSIIAEKDKSQYFISIMNIKKYQQELEKR